MIKQLALLCICFVLQSTALAAEIEVQTIALFKQKAMLAINGKKAKILKVGESHLGVTLIESDTDHAVIEIEGRREILTLSSTVVLSKSLAAGSPSTNKNSAQIWADSSGFFRAEGSVNGTALEFLVDTGANLVVLNSNHANRVDLEYKDGIRSMASTASGNSPMYLVTLDRISFEGIQLYNIQAGVIEGSFPRVPLLGMSYLNRLEMNRSGSKMTLEKRY